MQSEGDKLPIAAEEYPSVLLSSSWSQEHNIWTPKLNWVFVLSHSTIMHWGVCALTIKETRSAVKSSLLQQQTAIIQAVMTWWTRKIYHTGSINMLHSKAKQTKWRKSNIVRGIVHQSSPVDIVISTDIIYHPRWYRYIKWWTGIVASRNIVYQSRWCHYIKW